MRPLRPRFRCALALASEEAEAEAEEDDSDAEGEEGPVYNPLNLPLGEESG